MNINRMLLTVTLAGVMGILGCTSPLKSEDPATRARAVAELSTDKELFFVAMNIGVYIGQKNGSYHNVFLTQEQYPDDVRVAAVGRLKNMDYLLMCASWNDGDVYVDPGKMRLEYCGANYYFQGKEDLRTPVLPGNVVRAAAIKRLSDFTTFKEASKSLDAKAKGRLLPKPSSTMQRGSSSDGNAFIDYYGKIRSGNPLDKVLCTALSKLKQPDAAAEFLKNAAEGGQGIAPETFDYAIEHLDGVSSQIASLILRKINENHEYTKDAWLPMLVRYIDDPEPEIVEIALKHADEKQIADVVAKIKSPETAEKLLAVKDGSRFLINGVKQRISLIKRLPEEKIIELALSGIEDHSVYEWNEDNLVALELGIGVMSSIKDTKSVVKIASAILSKIAKYRKACKDSLTMNWEATDEKKATKLMGQVPKLSDDILTALVCLDDSSWTYFIQSVTADVAYKVLTLGKAKSAELEEALVKKLPADRVDMNVYNGVTTDSGKKAVFAAMPAELKKSAQEAAEKAFAAVLEKARVAAKETFELNGFYLGMDFDDMKQVLSHHFPDFTIKEARDGEEKDADYVVYVPKQSTPFCYASAKDKKVYQFNFGKVILKKWYKYDVQTSMEWARAYSRENKIEMKYKEITKETTVYEPMDLSRSYKVWFHQEAYQYKHNTKEYRLIYFGEEKDFTFHGGLGGALIKERAARAFRYIRADEGTLRACIERD